MAPQRLTLRVELLPRLERDMLAPVVAHFVRDGHEVQSEVHFNGRIADVLAAKDGLVTTVELKLADWPTAVRQALAYQVAAHRSFVALPLVNVLRFQSRSDFRRAFAETGCGLLAVNHPHGDVREIYPARASTRRLDFLTDALTLARE